MDTMMMMMPPPRARPRRRQSLQDSSSLSLTPIHLDARGHRYLERFSTNTWGQRPLELSLLEHVQVEFLKAIVSGSKLARPRYVLKVTNTALGQSWEMARPFSDFYDMKESMLRVLERGHVCSSNCPWLYVFVAHNFPRSHWFRSRRSGVISSRLTDLQAFMTTLLKMIREQRPNECPISSDVLPRILYDFLFEGMIFDRSDFNHMLLGGRGSLGQSKSSVEPDKATLELCPLCETPLRPRDNSTMLSTPPESFSSTLSSSEPDATSLSMGATSTSTMMHQSSMSTLDPQAIAGITTLECGHKFHDECILIKLNENLACPVCGTPQ